MTTSERLRAVRSQFSDLVAGRPDASEAINTAYELGREAGAVQGAEVYWRHPHREPPKLSEVIDRWGFLVTRSDTVLVLTLDGRVSLGFLKQERDQMSWIFPKGRTIWHDPKEKHLIGWMPVTALAELGAAS
jgi:hypothetical protein